MHNGRGTRRVAQTIALTSLIAMSLASPAGLAQTGAPCDASKEIKDCRAELSVDGKWLVIKTDTEKCARVEWQGDGMNRSTTVLDGEERLEILIKAPTNLAVTRCVEVKDLRALKANKAASAGAPSDQSFKLEVPRYRGWQFRSPRDSTGACRSVLDDAGARWPDGQCEFTFADADGTWTGTGSFAFGKLTNMKVTVVCSCGTRYTGELPYGRPDGWGTSYFSNGDRYEGTWRDGQFEGRGTYFFANGDLYEGEFRNGKEEGRGTYFYANGDRYEGEWRNRVVDGRGTLFKSDGTSFQKTYSMGQLVTPAPAPAVASANTQFTCAQCQAANRDMIERAARMYSQSYSMPCAKQGYQACLAYAEEQKRRQGFILDCSSLCAAESSGNAGATLASSQDCSRNLQSEINRLTDERQKCYSSVMGNPANAFACREIDGRIDALKRDRSNCGTNPDGVSASVDRSRQTDTNILPPTRPVSQGSKATSSGTSSGSGSGESSSGCTQEEMNRHCEIPPCKCARR